MKAPFALALTALLASQAWAHGPGGIHSEKSTKLDATFDLVHTRVTKDGSDLVFEQLVDGQAGSRTPSPKGSFAAAEVYSYVWPTSLDAGSVGFDWNSPRAVLAKLREEIDEIEAELDSGGGSEAITAEVGDLLFAVANLARHLKVDPDQALREANAKFVKRFTFIEAALAADGRSPGDAGLDEMEALWQAAKSAEQ